MPRSIVKQLIGEAQQDMRFDTNARVEVWVTLEDLEYDRRISKIQASQQSPEEKIAAAKQVALAIAQEKLSQASANGVQISADIGPESVNVDRFNWNDLVNPPQELPDEG